MTTPTPDALCERLRELRAYRTNIHNCAGDAVDVALVDAAATIERLSALVEESLYHLRLDEAAKAYHERALTALGKDASNEFLQDSESR